MSPLATLLAPGKQGISRFPCKVFSCMLKVFDRAGSVASRVGDAVGVAFRIVPLRRHPGLLRISRLNTWPARTPVNASASALLPPPHDSGPVWLATPSPYGSFIHCTLPVFPALSGHSIFPLSSIYFSLLLQMLKCSKDLRIHLSCKKASTSSASFSPPSTSSDKACRRTLCVSVTHIRDPNCCYRPQAFLIHAMSSEGGPVFVPPGVVSLLRLSTGSPADIFSAGVFCQTASRFGSKSVSVLIMVHARTSIFAASLTRILVRMPRSFSRPLR